MPKRGTKARALLWRSPRHAFGSIAVRDRNVKASMVFARWEMGESYEELAADLGVTVAEVVAAVHFELGRMHARDSILVEYSWLAPVGAS